MLRILAHAVAIICLYLTFSFALFLGLQVNPLYGNIGILACARLGRILRLHRLPQEIAPASAFLSIVRTNAVWRDILAMNPA